MNAEQLEAWIDDNESLYYLEDRDELVDDVCIPVKAIRALFDGKVLVPVEPQINEKMKAKCMGEFSVKSHERCQDCEGRGCHGCAGEGEIICRINVPWTVMKEIYKRMYKSMLAASQEQGK
jgi:hypothetical protein